MQVQTTSGASVQTISQSRRVSTDDHRAALRRQREQWRLDIPTDPRPTPKPKVLDRDIFTPYRGSHARIAGGVTGGLLLALVIRQTDFYKQDWCFITDSEVMHDTGLTPRQLKTAKLAIKRLPFIRIYRGGCRGKTHYRMDYREYERYQAKVGVASEIPERFKVDGQIGRNSQTEPGQMGRNGQTEPSQFGRNSQSHIEGTRTKTKKQRSTHAAPSVSGGQDVSATWSQLWTAHHGRECHLSKSDLAKLTELHQALKGDRYRSVVEQYFASDDPYYQRTGHPVGLLVKQLDRFVDGSDDDTPTVEVRSRVEGEVVLVDSADEIEMEEEYA